MSGGVGQPEPSSASHGNAGEVGESPAVKVGVGVTGLGKPPTAGGVLGNSTSAGTGMSEGETASPRGVRGEGGDFMAFGRR